MYLFMNKSKLILLIFVFSAIFLITGRGQTTILADTTGSYAAVKQVIEQSIGWAIEKDFEAMYKLWADNMFHFWLFSDSRGYFLENFNIETFRKSGIDLHPVQDNESRSSKGVIRGLHYQIRQHDQAKLIRVVEGMIYDVALDLRRDSPTYGEWYGTELDSDSKHQLFIPRGFAHGFSVLSDFAVIQYKVDKVYNRLS
jgi:dTDP-4-dehydrorhamnose 3,5-epimerase